MNARWLGMTIFDHTGSKKLIQHPVDAVTNSVAVASLAIPLWLPSLQDTSQFAALIIPILGAGWLILQIILKLHAFFKGRNH